MSEQTQCRWRITLAALAVLFLTACRPITAEPTPDPDIYNQMPDTTVFEPGQCSVVLDVPAPTYTSNTLGGQPSGEAAAGIYEVGVAAHYGSSLWYMLNVAGETPFINSTSVASTEGDCSTGN